MTLKGDIIFKSPISSELCPQHYFAAAGENDYFVIAVINFQLNQHLKKLLCYLIGVFRRPDLEYQDKRKFLQIFLKSQNFRVVTSKLEVIKLSLFFKFLFVFTFKIWVPGWSFSPAGAK